MTSPRDPMRSDAFLDAVAGVVAAGNCSGCGACAALSPALSMELSSRGDSRPVALELTRRPASADDLAIFTSACPGSRVVARRPDGSSRDAIFGPVVAAWQAWSTDPAVRHAGSSGGALSAIASWLLQQEEYERAVLAGADRDDPTRTRVRVVHRPEDAASAAGSRYAPVSIAAEASAYRAGSVVVGKPCEVSAIREVLAARRQEESAGPVLLSFFCAGVPSQHATDAIVASTLGPDERPLESLRYRGHGWPGAFHAVGRSGASVTMSYDESWGRHLGPTTQWRCKICPDGVGESADIVAGDFWHVDDRGYPAFSDLPGRSVLIARTQRGRDIILAAAQDGVLALERVDLASVRAVQPLQDERRSTLAARLIGVRAASGRVPRYVGFGLVRLAAGRPARSMRAMVGAFRRAVGGRQRERVETVPGEHRA